MKKKICSFFGVVIAVVMAVCASSTALAAPSEKTDTVLPDADFIKVCDQLFTGNGELYNISGMNVTDGFIEKYSVAYESKDYETILRACFQEEISQIYGHVYEYNNIEIQNAARTILNLTYEENAVHLIQQKGFPYDGKSWYITVKASGVYTYQDSYGGYIVDFPAPTISVSFNGLGALFTGSWDSITTTTPVINSSKTAASFEVTTTHTVSCPIPGSDYITGTLGPFTNVSNFTIKP